MRRRGLDMGRRGRGLGRGRGPDPEELKGGRMKEVVDMGVWGGVTYISDIARRGWATLQGEESHNVIVGGRSHMMSLCMWEAHDMMSLWGRSHMTCGGGVTCCEGCYTYHVASGLCEWVMWAESKREGVEASTMGFLCFPPFFSLAAGGIG